MCGILMLEITLFLTFPPMRKIALFTIALFPLFSIAQTDNKISSQFGEVSVDVFIKNKGPTFIMFDEIAQRAVYDTAKRDSGSVCLMRMGETAIDDPETRGQIKFTENNFKETLSFIRFAGLSPNTEYWFKIIISVNGITVTRKFSVKTSN